MCSNGQVLDAVYISWCIYIRGPALISLINILVLNQHLTVRPEQNGRHFADNICKLIVFNEKLGVFIQISQNFVPVVQVNNKFAMDQVIG